jgi:CheY-like chemotaxis protein
MLNILWVEDEYSEQKQRQWFKERAVTVKNSFDAAVKTISSDLNNYDVIVLDINLENSEHSEYVKTYANGFGLSVRDFLERSGMNLYFMLLENGFPKERIVFLTANANATTGQVNDLRQAFDSGDDDNFEKILSSITSGFGDDEKKQAYQFIGNPEGYDENDFNALCSYLESYFKSLNEGQEKNTYEILRDTANSCRIEVPKAFNKGSNQLDIELKKHEDNKYLVLRRGIIEGCRFLKKQLETQEESLQFREFIKDKESYEITATEMRNYLDALALSLVVRMPTDQELLNLQYRLFLRALVHEWEDNIDPNKKYKFNDIHTFAWLSKMARNWTSHANLLEPLNHQLIAFLFLVNMRSMFKLEKLNSYELVLLRCISAPIEIDDMLSIHIEDTKKKIDEILFSLKIPEYKEDKKGNKRLDRYGNEKNKDFGDKINAIYQRSTGNPYAENYDFKKFLLQYFWVNQSHKDDLEKLTAFSDEFLPTLARHIYSHSF